MKSVVETVNPTRVRLLIEVPFEELKPSFDSAYRKIRQQVVVPGFRKGKVPDRIIDQRFGRAVVMEEAVNEAVPRFYGQAIEDNSLEPLGRPEVDISELADGSDLKFTAEVDVRPKIELPDWDGIEVQVDAAEATDEGVAEQLEGLQRRFGTLVPLDRAAADGDFVSIDLRAERDGEPVEGAEASGLSYQIGSGQMLDGLDEALIGMAAGDSKTFSTTLHGQHEGLDVEATVTVQAVKEQQLPELDDDFAQMASEFDTIDELRDDLREQITRMNRIRQAAEARDKVLEALLERVDVPLPEGVLESQLEDHFEDGHGDDDHRAEVEKDIRRSMKTQFILDEIVKAEELSVSQDELTNYILQRSAQTGMDPNEFAQQAVQAGVVPALVADVARGKALALVVDHAVVVDSAGNRVPLDRLRDDGTLADEGLEESSEDAEPATAEAEETVEPRETTEG